MSFAPENLKTSAEVEQLTARNQEYFTAILFLENSGREMDQEIYILLFISIVKKKFWGQI